MDAVTFLLVPLFRNLDSRIQTRLGKEQPQQPNTVEGRGEFVLNSSHVSGPGRHGVTDWKGDDESSNAIYLVMKSSHLN